MEISGPKPQKGILKSMCLKFKQHHFGKTRAFSCNLSAKIALRILVFECIYVVESLEFGLEGGITLGGFGCGVAGGFGAPFFAEICKAS